MFLFTRCTPLNNINQLLTSVLTPIQYIRRLTKILISIYEEILDKNPMSFTTMSR